MAPMPIKKVAMIGAGGNFGRPITEALLAAGFDVTVITRYDSTTTFPEGVSAVVRTSGYADLGELHAAMRGHDAVVCALSIGGLPMQEGIVVAAEAAAVPRIIVSDFGRGPDYKVHLPDFNDIVDARLVPVNRARALAASNPAFSWTAVAIGNPTDWAVRKYPLLGFDVRNREAVIYDTGTEPFTGTTIEGIGQAVVGVLRRPDATANRSVRVRSLQTNQTELLEALRRATADGPPWMVKHDTTAALLERGRAHRRDGLPWHLELAVAQLYRGVSVLVSREESDNDLLGVREETVDEVVAKVLSP